MRRSILVLVPVILCFSLSNVRADLVVTDLYHSVHASIGIGYVNPPLFQPPTIYGSSATDGDISGPVDVYLQKGSHAFAYAEADHLFFEAWNYAEIAQYNIYVQASSGGGAEYAVVSDDYWRLDIEFFNETNWGRVNMDVTVFDDLNLLVTMFERERNYWDEDSEEYEYHNAIIAPGTYTLVLQMYSSSYAVLDSGFLAVSGASGHVQVGVSVIPAPGAFLLGSIGLSLAGWRLRKRRIQAIKHRLL